MFPGAHAEIYRNDAGEPIGWDYPSLADEPDYDPYDDEYYDPSADDEDPGDDELDILATGTVTSSADRRYAADLFPTGLVVWGRGGRRDATEAEAATFAVNGTLAG